MSRSEIYDAIVVGLGGVGSFALRSLARRNASIESGKSIRVLGLEQFQIGHELGSSHGGTRLFRHAYFEHENYVPLCIHSTKIFQEISDWKTKETNGAAVPLLERCGVLVVSDGGRDGNYYDIIHKCQSAADKFNIQVEILDDKDLCEKFGNLFDITDHMKGILEPGAGFVRPELAVQYAIEDAMLHGAHIKESTVVTSIHRNQETENDDENSNDIIVIETETGDRYLTRGLIVSGGAWASKLVPSWKKYLTVTRQIQAWYETQNDMNDPHGTTKYTPSSPGWFLDRAKDKIPIYGVPADPLSSTRPTHAKIALHGRNDPMDPDHDRPDVTENEIQELRDVVKDWIPSLGGERSSATKISTSNAKACLYTMTPDENFIVDRVPYDEHGDGNVSKNKIRNIWCVAGLSGHGFKMTPALGEAAADLVLNGQTDLPVEFLSAKRFSK